MTIEEWEKIKIGDKIRINTSYDKGRVVTVDGRNFVKFVGAKGVKGFMIGNLFYPCFYVTVVEVKEDGKTN